MTQGSRSDSDRAELDRFLQEQEQLLSWTSETKSADREVVYQASLSQQQHHKDILAKYAAVLDPNPFTRMFGMSPHTSVRFDVDRVYKLSEPLWCLDFAAPRLFLVLPSDLGAWDDNDSATHKFRLYFLCDFKYRKEVDHKTRSLISSSDIKPKHVHLSGHPGYNLERPDEFFEIFGHFALEMLRTIKDGYRDKYCSVPSLDTFEILGCCEGATIQHQLTRENIEPLVDQAIAHIQRQQSALKNTWGYVRNLLPQRYRRRLWMNGPETRQIRSFLHLPEGDSGEGGLLHTLYPFGDTPARWLCSGHAFEHSNVRYLIDLVELEGGQFHLHEGVNNMQHWRVDLQQGEIVPRWPLRAPHIDLQKGTISVSLDTPFHAEIFAKDIRNTKRTFDLAVRLAWGPTTKEIQKVLHRLVECNIRFLEIDASNLDTLHVSPLEYTRDIFVEHVEKALWRPSLFVTLLGYPQASQKYMYFGVLGSLVYGFILDNTSERPNIDWWGLQCQLFKFHRNITRGSHSFKDLTSKLAKLSPHLSSLMAQGLHSVDMFTFSTGFWGARFPVVNGVIGGAVAGSTPFWVFTLSEFPHPTLRRVIVQYNQPHAKDSLFHTMKHNPGLQRIDLPSHEHGIYEVLKEIGEQWHDRQNPLEVMIYEQGLGRQGQRLATVIIRKSPTVGDRALNIIMWGCSHVCRALMDGDAKILDALARDLPDALKTFTLNVSSLTEVGLSSIQRVLHHSRLEHLIVNCTAFDAANEIHLGQVLGAVQWPTIKSLTLVGGNIDAWIQLWARTSDLSELLPCDLQLLRLSVQGSGTPATQELSHSSALWLHGVIYLFSPVEVHIEKINTRECIDWELIRSAVGDGTTIVEIHPE